MKKTLALVLAAVMTAGMTTVAFAADPEDAVLVAYDTNGNEVTADGFYVMDDNVAKPYTPDSNVAGGDEIVLPLVYWTDVSADSAIGAGDKFVKYTDADQYKLPKVYTDWKIGEADAEIKMVKFEDGYQYAVVITVPENNTNKEIDLQGKVMVGRTKSSAEDLPGYELGVTYSPNGQKVNTDAYDGGTLESGTTGIIAFDKEAGEIDIEFGDETALFTVDVTGQGKLNLAWNTDFNKEVADLDKSANMDFVTFEGNPSFNKNGTMYIYADVDTYLYEVKDGKLVAVDAEYDEDYEAWTFKTRTLGAYVISDKELEEQVITDGDEDASSSTTEDGGKKNPDTGR